jgi:hypothetical protein
VINIHQLHNLHVAPEGAEQGKRMDESMDKDVVRMK